MRSSGRQTRPRLGPQSRPAWPLLVGKRPACVLRLALPLPGWLRLGGSLCRLLRLCGPLPGLFLPWWGLPCPPVPSAPLHPRLAFPIYSPLLVGLPLFLVGLVRLSSPTFPLRIPCAHPPRVYLRLSWSLEDYSGTRTRPRVRNPRGERGLLGPACSIQSLKPPSLDPSGGCLRPVVNPKSI